MNPLTLTIDRTFRGVGRIKRATGTTNPTVRRKMSRMLTVLYDDGRLDLLRGLRDGRFTLPELYDAYQRKTLDRLPTADAVRNLGQAMRAWLAASAYSPKHTESLGTSICYIEAEAPKATIHDIAVVLTALRKTLATRARSFNLVRAAALAFVRAELTRGHPLYLACLAVEPRKTKKATKRTPLERPQMEGFFPNRDTDPLDAMAWTMATTGMRLNEYFGSWATSADRILVRGTKTDAAVRSIPRVVAPVVPTMHRRTFENKLRERTNRAIQPYDLRRTYAHWMELARVPRARRMAYLGHAAGDVTGLYEQHEVTAFLAQDAIALRQFLGIDPTGPSGLALVREA